MAFVGSASCAGALRARPALCGAPVHARPALCGAPVRARPALCGAPVRARARTRAAVSPPSAPVRRAARAPPPPLPGAPRYPEPVGVSGERTMRTRAAESIPELFRGLGGALGGYTAVVDEHHNGGTLRLTYKELWENMSVFSCGLQRLGLGEGERVALFAENSARWLIADQGILAAGASAAVRGVDAPVDELVYIYGHSESCVLFVEDVATLEKVYGGGLDREGVRFVVLLYGQATDVGGEARGPPVYSFGDVLARGANPTLVEQEFVLTRSDVATILYTSGTTGHPKGVVLTHGNIMAQLDRISIGGIDPLPGEVFVSVLPCWHIFERTAGYYTFTKGMQVVYSNKRHFRDDLVKHRPHVLIAVPRVFENLFAAIQVKMAKANERRRALAAFFIGLSVAFIKLRRVVRGLSLEASMPALPLVQKVAVALRFLLLAPLYALANLLVWKKIRAATGGRVKLCVVGGGSMPMYLEDFFEAAKVTICVGYGLTETSPVIANRFGEHNVRGSAGLPLPDTFVKIVDQETRVPLPLGQRGELLVSGPQVFSEYYRDPEATAKAFDAEGYFDTGDLAYIGESGDVVITGRSKDVIVLSNGENIEPVPIEDSILSSPLVSQLLLVGQDEKQLCALVVPSLPVLEADGVLDAATGARIKAASAPGKEAELRALGKELVQEKNAVAVTLMAAVTDGNKSRLNYSAGDRVRSIRLVFDPFTVENGMLTQTLKVKRNVVADEYADEIAELCRQ